MIIDAHTFVHPDADGFGPRYDATLGNLLAQIEASPVDRAIIYPIACDSAYIKRTTNEYVAQCVRAHPDVLAGFASVHPIADPDPVGDLERAIVDLGLRGLKLHPRFQGFVASDDRVVPVVRKAAELGVPVAIDCMLWKPTPLDEQLPFHIDRLCKKVPEAKVIVCHAGGWRFLDALAVAVANDKVFVDISLSLNYFHRTPFEDQFVFVLKQIGAHRVVYGSDHPQEPLAACYGKVRDILEGHGFSAEQLEYVFGKTIEGIVPM